MKLLPVTPVSSILREAVVALVFREIATERNADALAAWLVEPLASQPAAGGSRRHDLPATQVLRLYGWPYLQPRFLYAGFVPPPAVDQFNLLLADRRRWRIEIVGDLT